VQYCAKEGEIMKEEVAKTKSSVLYILITLMYKSSYFA
jgi:hypothetical protein